MFDETTPTLNDCGEYRQAVQARPPAVVHATLGLCVALLVVALVWATWTEADLVVRLSGRVRPVTSPQQVRVALGFDVRTLTEGRVVAVHIYPGAEVHQGQVLVQLDTRGLDNEIAKSRRTIRTGGEELGELDELRRLGEQQHAAARAKTEAELALVREEVRQSREKQTAEVRLARVERETALDEVRRLRHLAQQQATATQELVKAELKLREADEKLAKAQLAVSEGRVGVLTRTLEEMDRSDAVKRKELDLKRRVRQSEIEAARLDLANLELRQQQASLRAPCDGVVTEGDVKVGDLLDPNKPVCEIAARRGFCFEGAVPSEEVAHLRVGLPARIRLDAFDPQRYGTLTGTVSFIAPDSRTGTDSRAVQYLVRVDLEGEELGRGVWHGRAKLGMAGQAEVVTGREHLLGLLMKRVRQSVSLQ